MRAEVKQHVMGAPAIVVYIYTSVKLPSDKYSLLNGTDLLIECILRQVILHTTVYPSFSQFHEFVGSI